MNSFNYIAVGEDGRKHKGTVTAADRAAARVLVVKEGLKPISINSAHKFSLNMQLGEPKVRLKDRVVFTRQLATLINAGVALPRSLNTLAQQSESKALKIILPAIIQEVEGGKPLAASLAKFPKTFDKIYVNMVKAGGGKASVATVQGEKITFWVKGKDLYVRDSKGNDARVTIADVNQSNGTIHVIDHVLMP